MTEPLNIATPVLAAAAAWWFGAGVVLLISRAVPRLGGARFFIAGLGLAAALALSWDALSDASVAGAYLAFAAAVGVWGWHEVAFLSGWITGPRRAPCPVGARGVTRFRLAAETVMHHELALAATLCAFAAAAYGAENKVGLWTFLALFALRLSAKLNLFFGAPNLAAGALPAEISHMASYFRRRPAGLRLALSTLLAGASAICVARLAFAPAAAAADSVGLVLIATLLALGGLEHVLMAAPIEDTLFWRWAFGPEPSAAKSAATRAPAID